MNDWFVGNGSIALRQNNPTKKIADVTNLAGRVSNVIRSLDPQVLAVEEGPSDIREMELFVSTFLTNGNGENLFDVFGGIDGRSQKPYVLVRKGGDFKNSAIATDPLTSKLQDAWQTDVDGDYQLENYDFTRLPLVVEGNIGNQTSKTKIVVLHTKSKFVQNGEKLWNDPARRIEFVISSVKNRRRISAEAMRVRNYVDEILENDNNSSIIVAGDFNDGPGIDYFEKYLTHNATDILLGSTYYPSLQFKHAFLDKVSADKLYTVIFDDFVDGINNRLILLDHILVSPFLAPKITDSGIAHQKFDEQTDNSASGRQKFVSDHRPVYIDLN